MGEHAILPGEHLLLLGHRLAMINVRIGLGDVKQVADLCDALEFVVPDRLIAVVVDVVGELNGL